MFIGTAEERAMSTEEDILLFRRKLKFVKNIVKQKRKIGPYRIVKPFEHHCLILTKEGFRESFVYADLAKFVR